MSIKYFNGLYIVTEGNFIAIATDRLVAMHEVARLTLENRVNMGCGAFVAKKQQI